MARAVGAERYHDKHPFHHLLHGGKLHKGQVQAWALNRYCYQSAVPRKDAALMSRSEDRELRREWRKRIEDHDGGFSGEEGGIERWLVLTTGLTFRIISAVTLVTGTMFLMWLGEQITERGLGNGISLIIFAGIAAGLPNAIGLTLEQARTGAYSIPLVLGIVALVVGVTAFVVFVERAVRKILVNYAKRQVGNKVYQGQSSFLPLKLNMAGVIPPIFASSIILFPATVAQWFGQGDNTIWLRDLAATLGSGQPVHEILYAAAIIFFCFFYTGLQYNPKETADNLKKSGAFIPGYRPGEQTAKYIEKITLRLTLIGSLYLVVVCFIPNFLIAWKNVPFYFGGTSLLIIVVVTMDFMTQVQAYMMSQQYESLLKKANFKGGVPSR